MDDEKKKCWHFITTGDVPLEQIMGGMYAYRNVIGLDNVFVNDIDMTWFFRQVAAKTVVYENADKRLALFPYSTNSYLVISRYNYTVLFEYPNVGDTITKKALTEKEYVRK